MQMKNVKVGAWQGGHEEIGELSYKLKQAWECTLKHMHGSFLPWVALLELLDFSIKTWQPKGFVKVHQIK